MSGTFLFLRVLVTFTVPRLLLMADVENISKICTSV